MIGSSAANSERNVFRAFQAAMSASRVQQTRSRRPLERFSNSFGCPPVRRVALRVACARAYRSFRCHYDEQPLGRGICRHFFTVSKFSIFSLRRPNSTVWYRSHRSPPQRLFAIRYPGVRGQRDDGDVEWNVGLITVIPNPHREINVIRMSSISERPPGSFPVLRRDEV